MLDGMIFGISTIIVFKTECTMSFRELEVYKLAQELVIDIHHMTLNHLPLFELYEEGGQIRRSSKSSKSTMVEGYGRRLYKQEFIKFLIYSLSSNDETLDHLENLYLTGSLKEKNIYEDLNKRLITLGKRLNSFIHTVEKSHRSIK
jgi:four helix bundle protein